VRPSSKETHQLNKLIIRYETQPLTRDMGSLNPRHVFLQPLNIVTPLFTVCVCCIYHGASAAFELSNQSEMNYARVSCIP